MKLSEFVLQRRGPYRFDHYIHPVPVPSPLGEFSLEFHVGDAAKRPPDETMLAAIVALKGAFESDTSSLVSLVHRQYLQAVEDEHWREMLDLPADLKETELEPLLTSRSITVSQHEIETGDPNPGRVYMSPVWDEEHGLYFARIDGEWVQVEC